MRDYVLKFLVDSPGWLVISVIGGCGLSLPLLVAAIVAHRRRQRALPQLVVVFRPRVGWEDAGLGRHLGSIRAHRFPIFLAAAAIVSYLSHALFTFLPAPLLSFVERAQPVLIATSLIAIVLRSSRRLEVHDNGLLWRRLFWRREFLFGGAERLELAQRITTFNQLMNIHSREVRLLKNGRPIFVQGVEDFDSPETLERLFSLDNPNIESIQREGRIERRDVAF